MAIQNKNIQIRVYLISDMLSDFVLQEKFRLIFCTTITPSKSRKIKRIELFLIYANL